MRIFLIVAGSLLALIALGVVFARRAILFMEYRPPLKRSGAADGRQHKQP